MLLLKWLYHVAMRRYYAAMLARGCPYPEIGAAWIYHNGAARDLNRRLSA